MKNVPGLALLGKPIAPEAQWASADGGYAQQFEKGWALIASNGKGGSVYGSGGVVTGPLLAYFESHGYVNAVGWPIGQAMSDSYGTWQKFNSSRNSKYGAIMSSSAGTFVLKGSMYSYYVNSNLRSALGSPQGEEARWAADGGGWAQSFSLGYLTYKSSSIKGYVRSEIPFPNISAYGWPTSGSYQQCGGYKVNLQRGYAAQDNRWCPASNLAQPVTSIAAPAMPSRLTATQGGDAGINVMLVQWKLFGTKSSATGSLERITGRTATAIINKRTSLGLSREAVIDQPLWSRLGINVPWALGTTPERPSLPLSATAEERRNAFIQFVKGKTLANGYPYTYGSAGPNALSGGTNGRGAEKYGYDCSGLMLAGLQYAGVAPKQANVLADIVHPTKLTKALYADTSLAHVALKDRKPGDLIFYTTSGKSDGIGHVGVYLGNNQIFDTENNGFEGKVRSIDYPVTYSGAIMAQVVRPIS